MKIDLFIKGLPAKKKNPKGDKTSPQRWKDAIISATKNLDKITKPCKMEVVFHFHQTQFPLDLPYGPDMDNYLKSLQDHLNETIFSEAYGKDSAIVELRATKMKSDNPGIKLEIQELNAWNPAVKIIDNATHQ